MSPAKGFLVWMSPSDPPKHQCTQSTPRLKLEETNSKCLVYTCSGIALAIILVTLIATQSVKLSIIVATGVVIIVIAKQLETHLTRLLICPGTINNNHLSSDVPPSEPQDPGAPGTPTPSNLSSTRCTALPATPEQSV